MSKNDSKFKDYYRDFTDVGVQIFKIREKPHADFAQLKEREGIKAPKESKTNKPPPFLAARTPARTCRYAKQLRPPTPQKELLYLARIYIWLAQTRIFKVLNLVWSNLQYAFLVSLKFKLLNSFFRIGSGFT
ncbi:MAG: hypothetical protein ACFNTA_00945 [Campylobacter sp.]|uniref:hypothetical protein n=1 Tax=Campylobacter sp. TaxID=205 RepID=UPI0036180627